MKRFLIVSLVLLSMGLAACEEEKKAAEERGTIPKGIVDSAQDKANEAEAKIKERLNQIEQGGE